MAEEITAAAVRYQMQTFALPPPARHGECIRLLLSIFGDECIAQEEQGFVTSGKRFVDRETARQIADAAGQTSDRDKHLPRLFSEDLW
jgi:hypothetical protein